MRSETFGELTFIDHGELAINEKPKLLFVIIYDGATSMTTAYVCNGKTETETIGHLLILSILSAIKVSWGLNLKPSTTGRTSDQLL